MLILLLLLSFTPFSWLEVSLPLWIVWNWRYIENLKISLRVLSLPREIFNRFYLSVIHFREHERTDWKTNKNRLKVEQVFWRINRRNYKVRDQTKREIYFSEAWWKWRISTFNRSRAENRRLTYPFTISFLLVLVQT